MPEGDGESEEALYVRSNSWQELPEMKSPYTHRQCTGWHGRRFEIDVKLIIMRMSMPVRMQLNTFLTEVMPFFPAKELCCWVSVCCQDVVIVTS